jgi:hypothetical protein
MFCAGALMLLAFAALMPLGALLAPTLPLSLLLLLLLLCVT